MTFAFALFVSVAIFLMISKIFEPILDEQRETEESYLAGVAEREMRFEKFQAWTECPRCLSLDLHPIKDTLTHSCRRECTNCKKVWRQV